MLTVFTFQKIQSLLEELGVAGMGIPSVVLKHLYDSFNAANFSEELYIVMLYGVYNVDTGIFSYASGGLNTTPLRLRPDGSIQELDSDGYAICKLGDLLKPKFVNHQIMLFPGDKLILYTDGLVEAVDANHQPYSKERLKEIISKNRKWNAERLTEIVMEDVRQYTHVVQDDVTVLILDVLRPF
jgi:sigma-B regulation protein RsbU (phosphoserine phosphatase)